MVRVAVRLVVGVVLGFAVRAGRVVTCSGVLAALARVACRGTNSRAATATAATTTATAAWTALAFVALRAAAIKGVAVSGACVNGGDGHSVG